MPRTAKRTRKTAPLSAPALARQAADRYVAALGSRIPMDNAPGDVNLIEAFTAIQDAYLRDDPSMAGIRDEPERHAESAMHAGYMLGVEIGRRLKGVA